MHSNYIFGMRIRSSKADEIYEYLDSTLRDGTIVAGALLPTDLQVAARFEVSRPTVARAMQRLVVEGRVVRKAGRGTIALGRPGSGARESQRLLRFGLLIPALGDTEIFEPICGHIANLAETHHFDLLWGGSGDRLDDGHAATEALARKYVANRVDGVFFTPIERSADALEMNRRILQIFDQAGIAVVLLDADPSPPPQTSDHDLVGLDNNEAGLRCSGPPAGGRLPPTCVRHSPSRCQHDRTSHRRREVGARAVVS